MRQISIFVLLGISAMFGCQMCSADDDTIARSNGFEISIEEFGTSFYLEADAENERNITDADFLAVIKQNWRQGRRSNTPTHWGSIDLSGCVNITDAGLEALKNKNAAGLLELDLDGCRKVTDKGLEHIKGLKKLRDLDLSRCGQITDAGLIHLKGLTKLRDLDLSRCEQITDAGLIHLKGLPELREIDIAGCSKITDAGIQDLKTSLPKCKIER
ncbi:MAG: leucine-rich repeat domain-containing protein [Planctomycetaceae bacterium]|jgi:hypothetical protein|nr:leucine-rich repeat domain-containing protein [Planctomycetaceae bacterium]